MLLERDEFKIKYGKIDEAVAIWKELNGILSEIDQIQKMRLLSDISGATHTLVVELEIQDLMQYGLINYQWANNDDVTTLYKKFVALCQSSEKNLFKIEA